MSSCGSCTQAALTAATQLQMKTAIDCMINARPCMSFFQTTFKQYTVFALLTTICQPPSAIQQGTQLTFGLPKAVDTNMDAIIHVSLPAITPSAGTYAYWTNFPIAALFQSMCLNIANQQVNVLYRQDPDLFDEVLNPADMRVGLMGGKVKNVQQLVSNSQSIQYLNLPIPFSMKWSTAPASSLYAVAMPLSQPTVTLTVTQNLSDILIFDGATLPTNTATNQAVAIGDIKVELMVLSALFDEPERQVFQAKPFAALIQQFMHQQGYPIKQNVGNLVQMQVPLIVGLPTAYVLWVYWTTLNQNTKQYFVYTDTGEAGAGNQFFPARQPFYRSQLIVGGQERTPLFWPTQSQLALNYEENRFFPSKPINAYYYGFNAAGLSAVVNQYNNGFYPSGTLNYSRSDNNFVQVQFPATNSSGVVLASTMCFNSLQYVNNTAYVKFAP